MTLLLVSCFASILILGITDESHAEEDPRVIEQKFKVRADVWQLAYWRTGGSVCDIFVELGQPPSNQEIIEFCGYDVFEDWMNTPPCQDAASGGGGEDCEGLLQRYVGESPYSYEKEISLPEIDVRLQPVNCTPGDWCESRPEIRVEAEEPLREHQITKVHLRVGGREKIYAGADAQLYLPLTGEQGDWLVYWAESDYGDESERLRVKYRSYQSSPGVELYRFDLLNQDWADYAPPGSILWGIFPPTDQVLPPVFDQVLTPEYLHTTNRYILLAGHLIKNGHADASTCPGGGLFENGSATRCGEKAAADQVLAWQNQYDELIYRASDTRRVPARIIKGIIAQETQFWPLSEDPKELGLGRITENGADLLLMWNIEYYLLTCIPIYTQTGCSAGFSNLAAFQQTILRRQVIDKIGTEAEIDVIAAMLQASAIQTDRMMRNTLDQELSDYVTFAEMWKISIGNYYAGSGCLSVGLKEMGQPEPPLTWDALADNMVEHCQSAKDYVERVMEYGD